LHGDSGDCAVLDVRVLNKKTAPGSGQVHENAMSVSGAVVAHSIDIAVFDVERFSGDKANAV
jgi:hypothetical protein